MRQNLGEIVTQTTSDRVVVAIARDGADLHPGDRELWRQLADDLTAAGLTVAPLQAIPAA